MQRLAAIEAEHGVRVLYACESGSRGWGFASPDSDYDVRFLYVQPVDWYLKVSPQRDVIELPISSVLDINGWELRKALGLLKKGNATLIEEYLGLSGSEILYVGDHLYTDVRVSKDVRRWRSGLIVRELEAEIADVNAHRDEQVRLDALMIEKSALEHDQAQIRLAAQRQLKKYVPAAANREAERQKRSAFSSALAPAASRLKAFHPAA